VLIKPITVRLLVYGQKANIAAIRGRAEDLLKDEHGTIAPAAFKTMPGKKVHEAIGAERLDTELVLKVPPPSVVGLSITLTEVNERLTVDWLHELPVAKTCVAFATWISHREGTSWQLLMALGGRWSESRPVGADGTSPPA
jgi:hypothetical protein